MSKSMNMESVAEVNTSYLEANVRKRSCNFAANEVDLLKTLVKKFWKTLECKKSDTVTWKQKNKCWETLAKEFNSLNGNLQPRTGTVLRKKWENCKKAVKQKVSQQKYHASGTGGGPPENIKLTECDDDILQLINIQATGNPAEYDCDVDLDNAPVPDCAMTTTDQFGSGPSWAAYSPSLLRMPISSELVIGNDQGIEHDYACPLLDESCDVVDDISHVNIPAEVVRERVDRVSRKHTGTITNKKWCELADEKKKIAALKMEKIKLEMKHMEEQQKLKLQILRVELQIKQKQLNS